VCQFSGPLEHFVSTQIPENPPPSFPVNLDWQAIPSAQVAYARTIHRPSVKSLFLAGVLFLLTLGTCLVAGTQFANSYAQNNAGSLDEFFAAFTLFYKNPASLAAGLPFALTLLTILLAHELGHFFACRHHHIRSSYPFFIPFPSLIGTFGAFILIRSPIRTARALFDVGASGPIVGFIFAVPALAYGILHARIVPGIADAKHAEIIFGTPLLLKFFSALFRPGISPATLLLHPIGRAAWVGLFATALNLLPTAQLDGGHILRSISPRLHKLFSVLLPFGLVALAFFKFWDGWYIWGVLLMGLRFLRILPVYDPTPLDPKRRLGAVLAFLILVLCFMPAPILISATSH
jgi:membrane-associated protease RseP (regulator of RpoE activity)